MIATALADLLVPVSDLKPWPGNPRRGDTLRISESLERFGQTKPIVVQASTMQVVAGNHTLAAAKLLGWDTIAASLLDLDDATARAYLVADNRHSDLSSNDDEGLRRVLSLVADTERGLGGTGFDAVPPPPTDEQALAAAATPPDLDVAALMGATIVHETIMLLTVEQASPFGVHVRGLAEAWQLEGVTAVVARALREQATHPAHNPKEKKQ